MFMSAVDTTIVNVAIPDISRDLHAAESELQWVMDGFLIALGGFLLVGSGAADRFGRARARRRPLEQSPAPADVVAADARRAGHAPVAARPGHAVRRA